LYSSGRGKIAAKEKLKSLKEETNNPIAARPYML